MFGVQVPVKGGYEPLAFAPDSAVLQRTGLYVASGDQVEIVVPEGTDDLQYQIGIGHQLLSGQLRQRYGNVVTRGSLHSGTNVVSSYFGGFLYFCYPADKVPVGDITVTVGNAVPSDDYVQGETRFGDWINTMLERAALLAAPSEDPDSMAFLNWTELVSDKVILTAGVSEMSAMTDPDGVLDYYGKIADAYYRFGGYDPANQPPMRVYSDIQLPDAGQTADNVQALPADGAGGAENTDTLHHRPLLTPPWEAAPTILPWPGRPGSGNRTDPVRRRGRGSDCRNP